MPTYLWGEGADGGGFEHEADGGGSVDLLGLQLLQHHSQPHVERNVCGLRLGLRPGLALQLLFEGSYGIVWVRGNSSGSGVRGNDRKIGPVKVDQN